MMEKIKAIFSGTDVEILERANVKNGFLKVDKIELRHRLFAGGWSDNINRELLVRDEAVGVLLFDPTYPNDFQTCNKKSRPAHTQTITNSRDCMFPKAWMND